MHVILLFRYPRWVRTRKRNFKLVVRECLGMEERIAWWTGRAWDSATTLSRTAAPMKQDVSRGGERSAARIRRLLASVTRSHEGAPILPRQFPVHIPSMKRASPKSGQGGTGGHYATTTPDDRSVHHPDVGLGLALARSQRFYLARTTVPSFRGRKHCISIR